VAAEKQLQAGGWDEAIRQAAHLASNFHAVMTAGEPVVYRPLLSGTVLVPVGQRGGVGYVMGWKIPGWAVGLLWGRSLGMEMMEGVLSGSVV
jgi:NADH dehydrogenase FAD-containing subunit